MQTLKVAPVLRIMHRDGLVSRNRNGNRRGRAPRRTFAGRPEKWKRTEEESYSLSRQIEFLRDGLALTLFLSRGRRKAGMDDRENGNEISARCLYPSGRFDLTLDPISSMDLRTVPGCDVDRINRWTKRRGRTKAVGGIVTLYRFALWFNRTMAIARETSD